MYVLVEGNIATVKTFPSALVKRLNYDVLYPKLYEVYCSGRQQLISVGRTQALQYTYFWKERLIQDGLEPEISVTDLSGSEINPGETNILPDNKTLVFKSTFDGELVKFNNNRIVDRRKMFADKQIELDGLSYGVSVQVIIGLDIVWRINFKKQQDTIINDEAEILRQIISTSGVSISVPHSLRNILCGMSRYPKICQWIQKCLKEDSINEQAYRRLQDIYRGVRINKQGDKI